MKTCLVRASGLLICVLVAAGCGSPPPVATVMAADLALYEGADRLQKLIDGARREGELTVYTSAQTDDLGPVVAAYEKKYAWNVREMAQPVYRLRARVGFGLFEEKFEQTATRWSFG